MFIPTYLPLLLLVRASFGCTCSHENTDIDCLSDDNVAPSYLTNICPDNKIVQTISLGFTTYCYRDLMLDFPELQNLYIAGGSGSDCGCYNQIICKLNVANCNCNVTSTSSLSTQHSSTGHTSFTTVSYATSTGPSSRTSENASDAIVVAVVLLVGISVVFASVIFIGYKYFYLKLVNEINTQREQLVENDDRTAREPRVESSISINEEDENGNANTAIFEHSRPSTRHCPAGSGRQVENDSEDNHLETPTVENGIQCSDTIGGDKGATYADVSLNDPDEIGIVNNGFQSTPKSALQLANDTRMAPQYRAISSGPITRQRLTRAMFHSDQNDENGTTSTDYKLLEGTQRRNIPRFRRPPVRFRRNAMNTVHFDDGVTRQPVTDQNIDLPYSGPPSPAGTEPFEVTE